MSDGSDTPAKGRRFAVEDAIGKSTLPPIGRHILLLIASRINHRTGQIPDSAQPTITWLQRRSGWCRATVCHWLNHVERAGWLARDRPPRILAATKHVRTKYTVLIPGEQTAAAATADIDPLAKLVTDLLAERTGKTITPRQAGLVVGHILNGHQVRQPEPYIRTVIRNETNPDRWLPIARPPTITEINRELAELREAERQHEYAS